MINLHRSAVIHIMYIQKKYKSFVYITASEKAANDFSRKYRRPTKQTVMSIRAGQRLIQFNPGDGTHTLTAMIHLNDRSELAWWYSRDKKVINCRDGCMTGSCSVGIMFWNSLDVGHWYRLSGNGMPSRLRCLQ